MLGFADGTIALAFLLCIGSTLLCAVYGFVNWNRGAETEAAELKEEAAWEAAEKKVEETLP